MAEIFLIALYVAALVGVVAVLHAAWRPPRRTEPPRMVAFDELELMRRKRGLR